MFILTPIKAISDNDVSEFSNVWRFFMRSDLISKRYVITKIPDRENIDNLLQKYRDEVEMFKCNHHDILLPKTSLLAYMLLEKYIDDSVTLSEISECLLTLSESEIKELEYENKMEDFFSNRHSDKYSNRYPLLVEYANKYPTSIYSFSEFKSDVESLLYKYTRLYKDGCVDIKTNDVYEQAESVLRYLKCLRDERKLKKKAERKAARLAKKQNKTEHSIERMI